MSTSIMTKLLSKPYLIVSVAMSSSDGREGYYYTVPIHHRYLLLLVKVLIHHQYLLLQVQV